MNNQQKIEELKNKLRKEIQKKLKLLELLRMLLQLVTKKEKLETEIMIRQIAKAKGLTNNMTDELVATIKCESGMDVRAINKNKNGTIDNGLCQFNDYWYGKVISPSVALNNPRRAVEVMCDMWNKGRQNDWICYRVGYYKNHL